ncbi:hypothetical protein QYR02_02435 [Microbacterium maritypicum]|uniref:hypothetical protein n=1 Tax=Microbacterium maritypicum TaxID=33918 RepID=UPI002672A2A0|nr:hypothetical protein [Microbacterium liquefaciens]WKT89791.1 hypothetical protein QYR02_02435 [Microbacterium liquefaciens]
MTKTIPFDKISTLTPGQRVTYESRYGNLSGTVGRICEGECVGIVSPTGALEVTFGPDHFTEGRLVVEEDQ